MLVWGSQVEKYHYIDVKSMEPRGRARGFRYTESEDQGLVALVKAKIKSLYERFFEPEPSVTLVPGVSLSRSPALGSRLRLKTPDVSLTESILLKPEVRIAG